MGSRLEQKSNLVRKRIEGHDFQDEQGDEYEGSKFGGFSEYFRRKKIKLQNLDAELRSNSDKPQIFKGIVCHVNGYTQPSLNDLHVMIVQHGGGFIQYLDGKTMVTHIIASNLTPKKKEEFKRYRIVKPAWIVDSVTAGQLLPWDAYRVIEEGAGQRVLGFDNGQVISQAGKKAATYREQTDKSWYTSQFKPTRALAGSVKQPNAAGTITPTEGIEDDEFSSLEITSSIEEALNAAEPAVRNSPGAEEQMTAQNLLQIKTSLQTPPPSSPPLSPLEESKVLAGSAEHARTDESSEPPVSKLRPREGSQEPDYSMAVVRNSEVLRSVPAEKLASMTAEEHNALLLSDPHIRKSTVVNPDFLDQYYRESRLHHLSTWKAELKSQLQALAAEKSSSQKAKIKKLPGQRRYIMHVDFDSFFAAVSLKKFPQYQGKPAVVAHGGGSGSEIASCNYPARKFGIKNGMWMKRAQDLCPDVKILPYDFPAYEDASRKFYDCIMATGGIVQSVSIDEALVDISAICIAEGGTDGVKRSEGSNYREQRKADETAQVLRDEVLMKAGSAVSVGIGGNILQAKVALRKAKPAGQYHLKPEDVLDFIGQLEVQSLPGIAWSIGGKLEEIGIKLVKDIREHSREKLANALGPKTGDRIWDYSRGIDRTEVGDQVIRKSVSAEVNWGVRFENQEQVDEFMQGLSGELNKRLVKERVRGRQLTMKVMRKAADAPLDPPKHLGHGKCNTFNKSLQLGVATNDTTLIAKEAIAMMKTFNCPPGELRGIGIQMQKLEPLKSGLECQLESSQRRLQFKTGPVVKATAEPTSYAEKPPTDDIQDDFKTPEKQRFRDINQPSVPIQPVNDGTPTKKPLNMFGTQFVMPTQVDPKVLAELPEDIRAKLTKHIRPTTESIADAEPKRQSTRPTSRAQSPAIGLPNMSQLDPSMLDALPDDVRAEVLGFYKSPGKKREQAVLPQSPRKNRTLPPMKQPLKRKRGGGLFAGKARLRAIDSSTLTQANFVARPAGRHLQDDGTAATDTEPEFDQLDSDFLAALPEDIRREVLDQQRQSRLQRTSGIDLSMHQRSRARRKKGTEREGPLVRLLQLPPRLPKPTFTTRKLSSLPDLRNAVKAWLQEFSDEGPYDEDVQALIKYLSDVVGEERDVAKAVQLVKWLAWVIEEEGEELEEVVQESWERALGLVKQGVQDALTARGLGRLSALVTSQLTASHAPFCDLTLPYITLGSSNGRSLLHKAPLVDHAARMIDPPTRLRRAITQDNPLLVQRLVRTHPTLLLNPDFGDKSNTSLHLAATLGSVPIASYLLSAGHETSEISRNVDYDTPLMLAAKNGQVEVGRLLVEECPRCVNMVNRQGLDALALCSQIPASTALIPVLLANATHPASPHTRDQDGNTPLHHASASGSLKALRILLTAGANPMAKNNYDWTPLAYSQTVAAEVYFKNLVAEFERRKVEGARQGEERERQRAAGVRLVREAEGPPEIGEEEAGDTLRRQWSPVERRRPITPAREKRSFEWFSPKEITRARAGSGD